MSVQPLRDEHFRGGVDLTNNAGLRRALDQMRAERLSPLFTSGGSLSAGVKATRTQSDGTNNTATWSGRLAGQHGNNIFINTARRTAYQGPVFDADVYATIQGQTAITMTANTSNEQLTVTAHGLRTGDPVRFTNSGGGLPAPLAATALYFAVVIDANTIQVATTLANALAATPVVVDVTTAGSGTQSMWKMTGERFTSLSMVTTDPDYFVRRVNAWGDGGSEWVTVAQEAAGAADAENRPSDTAVPLNLTSGAGENTLTGLGVRGDHVVGGVVQLSAGNLTASITADIVDLDKFVLTGTSSLANGDRAQLIVQPKV